MPFHQLAIERCRRVPGDLNEPLDLFLFYRFILKNANGTSRSQELHCLLLIRASAFSSKASMLRAARALMAERAMGTDGYAMATLQT